MWVTAFQRDGSSFATLADIHRLGHARLGGTDSQAFSDSRGPDASRKVCAFTAGQFRA